MKTVYVFGNEYLTEDNFAKEIAKDLQDVKLVYCTGPEELLDKKKVIILDVVKNIQEPMIITDIDQLKSRSIVSMHDFDVAFFLKLLKEMGITQTIKIIGIPQSGDKEKIIAKVKSWI
ncbi:hypothetical protein C4573_00345 [Candidatus Woesearchaeota archaeon]|nr:MAG: hypothetical protein C4573_00345 [Candidatus Woesearchaeota archaeon]